MKNTFSGVWKTSSKCSFGLLYLSNFWSISHNKPQTSSGCLVKSGRGEKGRCFYKLGTYIHMSCGSTYFSLILFVGWTTQFVFTTIDCYESPSGSSLRRNCAPCGTCWWCTWLKIQPLGLEILDQGSELLQDPCKKSEITCINRLYAYLCQKMWAVILEIIPDVGKTIHIPLKFISSIQMISILHSHYYVCTLCTLILSPHCISTVCIHIAYPLHTSTL